MANVVINATSEVRLYAAKVIAQVENNSFFMPMVGKVSNKNSFIYKPAEMHKKGKTWTVPLRKAVTTAALLDGATYEDQGQPSIVSTSDITVQERGQVFGGFDDFEAVKTILNLRDMHYEEAAQWSTMDFDLKAFSSINLATGSLPTRAARSASAYNVEFEGDAPSWSGLSADHMISARGISRCKKYMQSRGLRMADVGGGKMAFILIVNSEATFQLGQDDEKFQQALTYALPRDNNHIFFKGHGLNPWGAWDGVIIVEDNRPVYGGTDGTFLNTETEDAFRRTEGVFLGAQGIAYAEWKKNTWFERIFDHGRKFEVSVRRMYGFVKPAINLNTLLSASPRDYGLGYYCFSAPRIDN